MRPHNRTQSVRLRPPFCRIGSKYRLAECIIEHFPEHALYVEPFVGSGGVYWKKAPSTHEVINDIDPSIIAGYRLIKRAPADPRAYRSDLDTITKIAGFLCHEHTSPADKLTAFIIRSCGGFQGTPVKSKVYKPSNPYSKLKHIAGYKARLANTTIHNEDWKAVVQKYDSPHTLFYLDPPYPESAELYAYGGVNLEDIAQTLSKLQGHFVLSISDSLQVRRIFGDFDIVPLGMERRRSGRWGAIGTKGRTELLVLG